MAKVTITIEDGDAGFIDVKASFEPKIEENAELTYAQAVAVYVVEGIAGTGHPEEMLVNGENVPIPRPGPEDIAI